MNLYISDYPMGDNPDQWLITLISSGISCFKDDGLITLPLLQVGLLALIIQIRISIELYRIYCLYVLLLDIQSICLYSGYTEIEV